MARAGAIVPPVGRRSGCPRPGPCCGRILIDVDEPEPGWRPGDHVLGDLPDGQTVRCRVVNIKDDGTIQVVPEHAVVIGIA
jgi:hypothetical protein